MLNTYLLSFYGKTRGAIGITQRFENVKVKAENPSKACLKLYDNYDHISVYKTQLISSDAHVIENAHAEQKSTV